MSEFFNDQLRSITYHLEEGVENNGEIIFKTIEDVKEKLKKIFKGEIVEELKDTILFKGTPCLIEVIDYFGDENFKKFFLCTIIIYCTCFEEIINKEEKIRDFLGKEAKKLHIGEY